MLDLSNAKKNWNKEPGYTEAETTSFKNILDPPKDIDAGKFVDVWRHSTQMINTTPTFHIDLIVDSKVWVGD